MFGKKVDHILAPVAHRFTHHHSDESVGHHIRQKAGITLGGVVVIGALVALTIWAWPELQRTIKIHRM